MKTIFITLCALMFAGNGLASDTLKITLAECLQLAFEKGTTARTAHFDSLAAEGRWRTARASKYPQLTASGMLPRWQERNDYDLRYDSNVDGEVYIRTPSGTQYWQGGVNIDQELPWGTTLRFSTELYRLRYFTELPDTTIDFVEFSLNRSIVLDQPIFEGNPIGRANKINAIDHQSSLIEHEISRRNIRYQTMQAFFRLVSAFGELEIVKQDLQRGHESDVLAQRKYNAGLIPEVDMLQIQVDVARRENSYRQSVASLEATMDQLRLEIGVGFDQPIYPEFDMSEIAVRPVSESEVRGKRLELVREELSLDQRDMETRASVLSERIKASLQLFYEIDSRRDQFDEVTDSGDRNLGVTLNINFPIFGFGTTKGNIEQLRASYERAKVSLRAREASLASELRNALRNVELTAEKIKIADAALELMLRSYDITMSRFNSGLINSRQLLDAQVELTRTKKEALSARIEYELALANLERISPISQSPGNGG